MDTKESFFLTEEAANWIGQKKSEYLSVLINLSSRDDFGFEEYHLYDHLIPQTIEHPDQLFDDVFKPLTQWATISGFFVTNVITGIKTSTLF